MSSPAMERGARRHRTVLAVEGLARSDRRVRLTLIDRMQTNGCSIRQAVFLNAVRSLVG
jgi:hypothetical protein